MSWTEPEFSTTWKRPQKLGLTPRTTTSSALHVQPIFYNNSTTKVYAPRGGTASIECHVKNLGDRAVSEVGKLTFYDFLKYFVYQNLLTK